MKSLITYIKEAWTDDYKFSDFEFDGAKEAFARYDVECEEKYIFIKRNNQNLYALNIPEDKPMICVIKYRSNNGSEIKRFKEKQPGQKGFGQAFIKALDFLKNELN